MKFKYDLRNEVSKKYAGYAIDKIYCCIIKNKTHDAIV